MSFVNKFKQANSPASNIPNGTKPQAKCFGELNQAYSQPQFQHQSSAHKKGKPRGGWDDEDEDITLANIQKSNTFSAPVSKPSPIITTGNQAVTKPIKPIQQKELYQRFSVVPLDQEFEQAHEYEIKIISDLIQPGGARLKQPDAVLNEFCKASDSLQVEVIGSILLHNLTAQIVWISKARVIFAIEALVKTYIKYYEYFRYNIKRLRRVEFEDEGINAAQLAKIIDDVIDHLEDPEKASSVKQKDTRVSNPVSQPNSSATPEELPAKTYSQSAVYSTQPGLLTSQLASESSTEASPTKNSDLTPVKSSSGSFLSKFKAKAQAEAQTSPEQNKAENIIESLAGLNFNEPEPPKQEEVKPQQASSNFDDVYNMYLNSAPHGNFAHLNMQQNGLNQRAYQNGYGQYNQYNPQMNNAYNNHYNPQFSGQNTAQFYPMQGTHNIVGINVGMNVGPTLTAEEYLKSKQHEENEKRFANLKFGF